MAATQINRTQTYFADHVDDFAHDAVQRYLKGDRLTAADVWTQVRPYVQLSDKGYVIFDDSVMDKSHSRRIALVHRQWSGNEKRAIRGIGVVTCVYVNPETREFWIIDYRIYAPDSDGKTKIDHVLDMLRRLFEKEAGGEIQFRCVLMDTWYAVTAIMLRILRSEKYFCCPVKGNRTVYPASGSGGEHPRQRGDKLAWTPQQESQGQEVRLNQWPKTFKVRMFRLVLSTERTEWIVTNDSALQTADDVRQTLAVRWFVEIFHRELKQITGIESCQCRLGRSQRNHIGMAMLVWIRLTQRARAAKKTIYAVKFGLLEDYMRQQLKNPSLSFA